MNKEQLIEEIYSAILCHGLVPTLHKIFGKNIKIKLAYSQACCDTLIDELSLSVRSFNALKRANLNYIGDVIDAISQSNLLSIRNLGKKSISEIKTKIMVYGFEQLTQHEQKEFISDMLTENGVI